MTEPLTLQPDELAPVDESAVVAPVDPTPKPDEVPTPAPDEPTEDEPEVQPVGEVKAVKKTALQRFREFIGIAPRDDAFTVFKAADGKWHWHAVFTNNFQDREGEILTDKAHDTYIARLDMGLVPMPVLQAWHTPGTEHGEADIVWRSDHFVHAAGHFYDTPLAEKAIAFYRKNAGKIKMSHGFVSPEWAFDGKHYDDYNTIEITTLPPHAAANPYTSFEELMAMKAMSEEKRRHLETMFGKDKVAEIEAADDKRAKALQELEVEYKDFSQVTPDEKKPDSTATEKALGELYTEMVAGQNELIGMVGGLVKSLKERDGKVATLESTIKANGEKHLKELNELRTLLNQPPRRASADEDTLLTDTDKEVLKDKTPQEDAFAKFIGLPTKGSNN